eukprot:9492045-Pyramimonas_sp.AAC.1
MAKQAVFVSVSAEAEFQDLFARGFRLHRLSRGTAFRDLFARKNSLGELNSLAVNWRVKYA